MFHNQTKRIIFRYLNITGQYLNILLIFEYTGTIYEYFRYRNVSSIPIFVIFLYSEYTYIVNMLIHPDMCIWNTDII